MMEPFLMLPRSETVPTAAPASRSRHVPALDGIRGIAILSVMLLHAQMIWKEPGPGGWLGSIAELGQHGVVLFFVLSGFLITGILDDARDGPHYFRNFYARRALRIFPLYYLFLVLAFYVQPHLVHKPDIAAQFRPWFWLYGSNFLIARNGFLATSPINLNVTWSLAIEEQFYIVWPLIVFWFRGRSLRVICLLTVACSTLFRMGAFLLHADLVSIYVLTPSRLDALALGAWTALLLRDGRGLPDVWTRKYGPLGAVAIVVAVASFLAASRFPENETLLFLAWVVGLLAFSISFAALLLHVSLAGPEDRWVQALSFYPLRLYGKFSYFLYLFHWAILRFCALALNHGEARDVGRFGGLSWLVFVIAVFLVPLIPALLSWHFFEKPLLHLKRFFPARG